MKVLFAVSNDKMSESIVRQYQKEYKQIISYKNVYYFNAILKELQRDKTYDRIIISEDLEQYVNTNYEQMDKFLFDRLDSISDEASNMNGEDIPIILICTERRNKGEQLLVRLFGIGIYNAILGTDRSVNEVCRLLNRPRSKKEAKIYYKIDSEDVTYEKNDENDVSEQEIQNILAHYKSLGNNEERFVESFNRIASQYNDTQLRVISKFLPLNVKAVLEANSTKYQEINSYNNKISDKVRVNKKSEAKSGTSEVLLQNVRTPKMSEPVVVPSSIDTSQKKKVGSKSNANEIKKEVVKPIIRPEKIEEVPLDDIEIEDIPSFEETEETFAPTLNFEENNEPVTIEEEKKVEEPVVTDPPKRKRGRPRKVVEEPVVQAPKRKRGRPRKVVEPVVEEQTENAVLPGIQEEDEGFLPGITTTNVPREEKVVTNTRTTPIEKTGIPGIETSHPETYNPVYEDEEESVLPGFENDGEIEEQYTNVLKNLKEENDNTTYKEPINVEESQYEELDIERLLSQGQKIVAFLGTSKNGTSFLVNNVAELLSSNGIDTAILDLTQNRNAYYIYTRNEDDLREKSNYLMRNLVEGRADGLKEHRNLTIYTSAFENDTELTNVEPIIETLARNHTVVLLDCDFTTPMKYFKYAQEIYLVQSMDILTIQPLTAFLRKHSDKGMLEESKVRVILNKFMRTKQINEELLIGGISIYNDASMTVRKELFNRRTVPYITIPFEMKTYLRYLDGLVVCDVSLKGYSKEFMQSLKQLANMIYNQGDKSKGKYKPPSIKNNTFSTNMSDTLNQMRQSY